MQRKRDVSLTYRDAGSSHRGVAAQQTLSENTLGKYMDKPGELTVSVKSTSGDMKTIVNTNL
jgi:hypothetical protein